MGNICVKKCGEGYVEELGRCWREVCVGGYVDYVSMS
jgi:hypothetical protein